MSDVFLLTGCASGIGRHLTRALSSLGHQVVATDINEQGLTDAARADGWSETQVIRRRLDVRDGADWQRALDATVAAFGRLDVLMNIAGYLLPGWSWELDATQIDRHLDINVKGLMHGVSVGAKYFVGQGRGHLINIGSLASLAPVPGLSLYSASKFAVRGFTLAVAQELRPKGVKVSLVMPDAVQTPMLDLQVGYEQAAMTFSGPRALTVEDIERAIIDEVLPNAPLELPIPFGRGAVARFATFLPAAAMTLGPLFTRKGKQEQARRQKK
ncbi:MAG: SDR family oxidoreductase [Archangium sp.]|nr:SDR family oxidoreductase [Archangium sp.]MDP3152831.1 SDR family oxidoreductase [Archangium sp.]MDP3576102.1 SDR family oxidoreductase [Archangium sp.]